MSFEQETSGWLARYGASYSVFVCSCGQLGLNPRSLTGCSAMHRVESFVEETLIEVKGRSMTGIVVTCGRCEHCVEVPGLDTVENRLKGLRLLHDECPESEDNHYYAADENN